MVINFEIIAEATKKISQELKMQNNLWRKWHDR
jgi:uncharacterized protein with HEPN domain